ncbi:hypothetical protein [Vulcanococcus sp. DEBay_Sum22DG08_74]|jgi:hypothetical protein|uniref:hypothetical protein n=1 Tax=Vulcanococcus sp. DEBay_Sum22DG08_74 TaxID=2806299 RepID=UPI0025CF003A|nr:hypothetical protein [Vulcanococcus sp. DEBay_Sum22DG08_74]
MDSFQSVLGDAAGGALCNVLAAYGSTAPLLTAISLIEPTPVGEALAVSAGLAGFAATVGCTWDVNGNGPTSEVPGSSCATSSTGSRIFSKETDGNTFDAVGGAQRFSEITGITHAGPYGSDGILLQVSAIETGGALFSFNLISYFANPVVDVYLIDGCSGGSLPPGLPPDPPTYTHTDPTSGCEINVDFQGWAVGPAGEVGGVWLMEPAAPQTRASGGVIGGCNFAPTIYYDGGGGGGGGPVNFPVPDPVPPDGSEPWWAPLLRAAAAGVAAAVVNKALEELFERPYPAGSYSIHGVCERDEHGYLMPVKRSSTYLEAPGIDAVLTRLDALADLFQYHKELRQPICRHPRGSGELVTVNFVSDAPSPQGSRPLRKFLRYRDQSGTDLVGHGAHWRDFSWQAGPVIVSHENGPWGQLKVWALDADEGKRVIRHAGAVAGVNPDAIGDWVITGSSDPRYGQTGTMRVERRVAGELRQQYLRVTKRSDPNGMPLLPAA